MFSLAIVSDLHGDVDALRKALGWIDRLGCNQIVCAGDLVDTGPQPDATLTLLASRAIPCIRGNHDRWAAGRRDGLGLARDDQGNTLTRESTDFLHGLPTRWSALIEDVRVVMAHASPRSDMEGIDPTTATDQDLTRWLDQADADVLLVGHTHVPFALPAPGGRMIANPGSLLRDGGEIPTSGTFGVLELPSRRFRVYRVDTGAEIVPGGSPSFGSTRRTAHGGDRLA